MMINKDIKDIELTDLLEMQKQLDEEVAKPRDNGFVPRQRTLLDIKLALDDEFQEWLRELPQELNFKTWKKKDYKREDELIELVDCLFFLLSLANNDECDLYYQKSVCSRRFDELDTSKIFWKLTTAIHCFKESLWSNNGWDYFGFWCDIANLRGFTKEEIIQAYLTKWKRNITVRVKEEW